MLSVRSSVRTNFFSHHPACSLLILSFVPCTCSQPLTNRASFADPGLSWKDIDWFKSITKMPIILKGVQCWEDAVLAAEAGLAGVVLSNHGGRCVSAEHFDGTECSVYLRMLAHAGNLTLRGQASRFSSKQWRRCESGTYSRMVSRSSEPPLHLLYSSTSLITLLS